MRPSSGGSSSDDRPWFDAVATRGSVARPERMSGRPEASDPQDDVLFAMGFFAMVLPVVAVAYAIGAVVIGWARPIEAGVAFLAVLTQVCLLSWSEERWSRKRLGDVAWAPVIILAKLVGRLSRLPGLGGIAAGLAAAAPLWYPALVLALAVVLLP